MMSDDNDTAGEDFGQCRPPLSEIIKGILDRYPDGQIFKEVIQNADDAGAKCVHFYIDYRQHDTCSLPNEKLRNYQGPALISANDARFSEEDWVGIQKLQRSIKAKDPFKVGKFGIGFNSVYHVTDLPIIISGKRVAYLEPQEQIWSGKPRRSYELSHMQSNTIDALRPFENIFGFSLTSTENYPYTLFRFPLRTVPSNLSQVTYTTKKAEELVDALRVEAKFLLLFLRSINSIEVFRISEQGKHSLLFKTCISDSFKAIVQTNRAQFKGDLQNAYARESFKVSTVLCCTSRFRVEVHTDCIASNPITHDWLVVNQAGSKVHEVLEASPQQSAFPLVGAALELSATESPSGGRIFCFLPMPIEIASGLPVHVNGTFGLTDDRRSLKWPGAERKNDLTAKWNKLLVKELLPACYLTLAIEANKYLIGQPEHFYAILPDVTSIHGTQWDVCLEPFLKQLFKEPVVFSELSSKWVVATQPSTLFVPQCGESLPATVLTVISSCGFNIVNVPSVVWKALRHLQVSVAQVSPGLIRNEMRSKPSSYTRINSLEKRNLLLYCLSDKNYSDLQGLELIPLANGLFKSFQSIYQYGVSHMYLCSSDFPRYLLPNLDHKLVDVSNDTLLQSSLCEVASKKVTNLMPLSEENVASLLNEAMPLEWKQINEVSLPHFGFPSTWFKTFWLWIRDKNLRHFQGKLVVPVSSPSEQPPSANTFHVVRLLATHSPGSSLYIPSYEQCSIPLQKALMKLQVKYSMQQHFPYLSHQQLQAFLTKYDPPNLLNAIQVASHYVGVNFLEDEAEGLLTFLCPSSVNRLNFTNQQMYILQNIPIFKTAANSNEMLYSVAQATSSSITNKALLLQANFNLSFTNLPTNLLLFKRSSHRQVKVLEHCANVASISDVDLLVNYIFPRISNASFPSQLVNPLMKEVLDLFNVLQYKSTAFATTVQNLPFLDTGLGYRVCPKDSFDPLVPILTELYKGKKVFPLEPFNRPKYIQLLRQCGLHTTVTPQEVVDIVSEIHTGSTSSIPKPVDQLKLSRSKAVLCVIGKEFQQHHSTLCRVSGIRHFVTFQSAMNSLAKTSSWLPVLANPPDHYPSCLPWRGRGYNSHVISLTSDVVVVGPNDIDTISCLVGSQMFIVSVESQAVADLFEKHKLTKHVLAHFEEIIRCKDGLQANVNQLVIKVYSYLSMNDVLRDRDLNKLCNIQNWIYLRKRNTFVSPKMVALNLEPTFQRNLEPYLFVLPEILLPYAELFTKFGVETYMTQSQILLVLEGIKDHYSSSLDVSEIDCSNAWDIVMNILNWITNNGTKQVSLNETLYVPIQSESKWPQLAESKDVVYTDNDFLKDFLMSCGSDKTYTFVDSRVPQKLAECLCLTPLSEYLGISEDTFEDSGQHEPLTVRLKNILRDYKDGLTIVKELLQNADDAEATEVNICYDARTHTVPRKELFFPGMLKAHGPALLVHNNRPFTEEDFKNITKLAGATKRDKQLKIGKFGVGFCSVYHITDVPSFVSQDKLCIFDPTLSVLKHPSRPGKKVNFTSKFIAQSSQLLPYKGLFEFQPAAETSYQGTLFRFPFRSCASELSSTCYTEATVNELMTDIQTCGSKLLLFLQHVKRITFQRISSGQQTPEVLLTITKESIDRPIRTTSIQEVKCGIINKLHPAKNKVEHWLIANDSAVLDQRSASASVACQLNPAPTTSSYSSIAELDGEVFCYLPLSQKTGLPVHVSSNFAVINNRRGIWTSDEATSRTDTEVQWNEALMQHVIPKAYVGLLCKLQDMNCHNFLHKYLFYSLWPLTSKLLQHNPWCLMVDELYRMISIAFDLLFYSSSLEKWLTLNETKFLQPGILSHTATSTSLTETPKGITKIVSYLKQPVVDLPEEYRLHLSFSENRIVTEERFIELFFDNLSEIEDLESRNLVLIHMLEVYAAEYDEKTSRCNTLVEQFGKYACVPCTTDGTTLRHFKNVVSPSAPFAQLFDPSDARFPIKMFLERHLVCSALSYLGMIHDLLPWGLLIERAQTVSMLYKRDRVKALNRAALIIHTLNDHKFIPWTSSTLGPSIDSIIFLPVLPNPFKIQPWYGQGCQLSSGQNMLVAGAVIERSGCRDLKNAIISGSQVKFVCEETPECGGCGHITFATLELLHIRTLPTCEEVIKHFKVFVISYQTQEVTKEMTEWCDQLCAQVYEFFNDSITIKRDSNASEDEPSICAPPCLKELFTFPCIWNGETFLEVSSIAKLWKLDGPYLFPVPASLACRQKLSMFLNIKHAFSIEDVRQALIKMKEDFGDAAVNECCQTFLKEVVPILDTAETDGDSEVETLLPDEDFVLHLSTELAYNDAPWAPKDTSQTYVNDFISRALAEKLHVKSVRSKFLEKYESSPFGQKEELTRRIGNIIRDYPFDITVLKELLQNADDAKATKMYIILDKRTHGTESVLSENWQELQGPALLVWNDSTFSEKDFKGIQELGLGGKRSDAESIGQYGIGFNVVYHLTDCPSFISGGETLCIMDPHCKFVPGAMSVNPGRRFDNISSGLWEKFPDVKSSYLQANLENSPPELLGGSLFRFPLRCTSDVVKSSKIVKDSKTKPLTADDMHCLIHDWAPQTKDVMLFLNNVTELKFCIIEENRNVLMTENSFHITVSSSDREKRTQFHNDISEFKNQTGEQAQVIMYPLTLSDIKYGTKLDQQEVVEEKWLIQQGVGDIENDKHEWDFVNKVKPRHGIAAPLPQVSTSKSARCSELEDCGQSAGTSKQKVTKKPPVTAQESPLSNEPACSKTNGIVHEDTKPQPSTKHEQASSKDSKEIKEFCGQVFCFLPLPLKSKLPVHINGNFMLNSNRRDLWHATSSEDSDERSRWNDSLISAIASSYAKFLVDCQNTYMELDQFASIKHYYLLFPQLTSTNFNQPWLQLAKSVYEKLYRSNLPCLAVVEQQSDRRGMIRWCQPTCSSSLMDQVYIWKLRKTSHEHDYKVIRPILRKLGMVISSAPYRIKKCFDSVIDKKEQRLPKITPTSVYKHYKMISSLQVPCSIEATPFEMLSNFKEFTAYLLQYKPEKQVICEFPSDPYDIPLLLTNDGILRCFKEHSKVIVSKYCELFDKSSDKFVHLELLELNYSGDYFLECTPPTEDDDSHYKEGLKLVFEILAKFLPPCIEESKSIRLDCTQYLTKDRLKSLWECFTNDPTFQFYLSAILKHWALLLSIDCHLFSSKSSLLPVLPPEQEDPNFFVYELFHEMQMPFLDTSVIVVSDDTNMYCPQLDDYARVLKNVYCLHQSKDLSNLLTRERVQVLIRYLKKIDFRNDWSSRMHVESLPLFETADGQFSTIQNKRAFIWPSNVCMSGYDKWAKDSNVVFILRQKAWSALGSAEQLGIRFISAEYLYTRFIFPKFNCLTTTERYSHLRHIRDNILDTVMVHVERQDADGANDQCKQQAQHFFTKIRSLHCIGETNEALRPATDFYSQEEKLFLAFDNFLFLPKYFTQSKDESKQWLEFFTKIGLRIAPTTDEYLQLCCQVAEASQTSNLCEKSLKLTNYLFSKKARKLDWHENGTFLCEVSQIPFVCSEQLPHLTWIKPAVNPMKRVVSNGDEISLVRFCDVTTNELNHAILLWTVKPVIIHPHFHDYTTRCLVSLNVCMYPSVQDVIDNFKNICEESPFANHSLFKSYPSCLKVPSNGKDLIEVIRTIFTFLDKKFESLTEKDFELLRDLPCIPVYSTQRQIVLVKPRYVLKCDMLAYHPFLHSLPDDMYSIKQLLPEIGVKNAIELSHIQLVLEKAFKNSEEQEIETNTYKCIQVALKELYCLLQTDRTNSSAQRETTIKNSLSPLYLPCDGKQLGLSTQLVYRDKSSYGDTLNLSFSEVNLRLVSLPANEYGFHESHLCQLLPKSIRPLGLSEICAQTVSTDCKTVSSYCSVAAQVKQTLSVLVLAKAIVSVVKHITQNKDCSHLERRLFTFLSSISVTTVQNLETEIKLRDTGRVIGKGKVDFFFCESESKGFQLEVHLDSNITHIENEYVISELAETLLSQIKPFLQELDIQTTAVATMLKIFTYLLKSESFNDVMKVLRTETIVIDGYAMDTVICKLGNEVPDSWQCRLNGNSKKIFTPEEYVGYSNSLKNGCIVLAQIVHAVLPPGEDGFDSIPPSKMFYKIRTDQDDETRFDSEVSVANLRKFLTPRALSTSHVASVLLSAYGEAAGPVAILPSIDSDEIRACKKQIDRELRKVWIRPQDEKMRALHCLYLKWHPDKNPDNVLFVEELFKYLMLQIRILEDASPTARLIDTGGWQETFKNWDSTALKDDYISDEDIFGRREKDPVEGKRWIQQAEVDFSALCVLHNQLSTNPKLAGHVCFMAHQVAEKALKGATYAECGAEGIGLALTHHKLTQLACDLQGVRRLQAQTLLLTEHVRQLEWYYLDPRYPNRVPKCYIPATLFKVTQADEAHKHAHEVLKIVQSIIFENDSEAAAISNDT